MSANPIILVNNDFHSTHGIFALFDDLLVTGMDDRAGASIQTNGDNHVTAQLNGSHKPDDPNVFNEVNK